MVVNADVYKVVIQFTPATASDPVSATLVVKGCFEEGE